MLGEKNTWSIFPSLIPRTPIRSLWVSQHHLTPFTTWNSSLQPFIVFYKNKGNFNSPCHFPFTHLYADLSCLTVHFSEPVWHGAAHHQRKREELHFGPKWSRRGSAVRCVFSCWTSKGKMVNLKFKFQAELDLWPHEQRNCELELTFCGKPQHLLKVWLILLMPPIYRLDTLLFTLYRQAFGVA